jgi:hypothetical protein
VGPLFWRRRRHEVAARLPGASEALQARNQTWPQPNGRRLVAQLRSGLEAHWAPDVLAGHLAAGGALGVSEVLRLIAQSLDEELRPPVAAAAVDP